MPGTTQGSDGEAGAPFQQALNQWAEAAVPVLEDVARTYPAHITYSELRDRVFEATGVRTGSHVRNWIGKVLYRVIRLGNERGLPPLTSLVVRVSDGMVGEGFDAVLRAAGRDVPATDLERERAAAAARLECYRAYGADVPADAEQLLTPRYEARVNPPKTAAPRARPVCPIHGLELSASGVCAFCD
ncbi:hypothetical protein [Sinomonas sp. G460-2]|uniref:hypothetical protein n=1 Tax=Sinomonas sp. G460-2 TaxID=3393464 RepID=UPI0039F02529